MRAATARALMASGLLPSLGIFHRNYYDAFPLADDIMKPYRPFIDQIAYKLHEINKKKLDKEVKNGRTHRRRIANLIEPRSTVCLLSVTDREFLEIYNHFCSTRAPKKWPKSQD